jgi:hypothetical protein
MDSPVRYLEDLERRIDADAEADLWNQWAQFWRGEWDSPLFCPEVERGAAPGMDWPDVHINDAIEDNAATVASQLRGVSDRLSAPSGGSILSVRANYGVGILASVFGAELFMMPREQHCLPNVRPITGGTDGVKRLLDQGVPDIRRGLGGRALETGGLFVELFAGFPKVRAHIHIYHPDLQGPFDIFEMVFGSEIFMALMDEPDLVHQVLELITRAYLQVIEQWRQIAPLTIDEGLGLHWGLMHRGAVMLRDDSAMNLSPQMFDQFIRPYEQRVLDAVGGGAMHACGRVEHFVDRLPDMPGLSAFNMSQPQLNDIEQVYRHTLDRGIVLIGLDGAAARASLAAGRDLKGRVHTRA